MTEIYSRVKGKKATQPESGTTPRAAERVSVTHLKSIFKRTGSDGLFSSYATFPPHMYFETQEEGEEVVLFLRQHLIVNVPWMVLVLFALAIPSTFIFFPPYAAVPLAYQFVVSLIWYLFVAGFTLSKLMSWFFNIYIITDERVVDIDFINILYRKVSTAKIDEIQDVSVVSSGAFETFFNFGSVFIQTSAEVPEFEFTKIPKPDKVGAIINQMIDLEEQETLEKRVK